MVDSHYPSFFAQAAIIGFRTKKVLFVGVRNKFCTFCARAKVIGGPREHTCYRNWRGSSTSMERDIIVEGFRRSLDIHGLKYTRLIADGDSSTYKCVLEAAPYGHHIVQKVECRNHVLRNYSGCIRDIAQRKRPQRLPSSQKVLLLQAAVRLRSGVASAIRYRSSQDGPLHQKIRQLEADIRNGPSHVFGEHQNCATYFCSGPKNDEFNRVPELRSTGVYEEILVAMNRVADNSFSLIHDVDNNAAEHFNSVVAKFVGGKRVNFCQRRSYNTRCLGAAVSFNARGGYHRVLHKSMYRSSPGRWTKAHVKSKEARLTRTLGHKIAARSRARSTHGEDPLSHKNANADHDYGPNAQRPDMAEERFAAACETFLETLELSQAQREQLERDTRGQAESPVWFQERRKRLTASSFGRVCKMREHTSCEKTVRALLYSSVDTDAMRFGRQHEALAIQELEEHLGVQVQKCGLFVHPAHCYLAASPDGLVGKDKVVEVKCPKSASTMTIAEAMEQKKLHYMTIDRSGNIALKPRSDYWYQIQGQLNITERQACFFVVRTEKSLFVQEIARDDNFWSDHMLPLLSRFYRFCLVPELVDPRVPRSLPVREPSYICEAQKRQLKKQATGT
ncbi:uncharacterized protein LOC142563505 [Dermacentor variabilis]|uniref:uncharacterized protein LOC142563505 n=1 Tax=Dermacentor variabilis TaxID=34621 RepID=UPI003F5B44BF